jgi:hypothetical protein
MIISYFSTKGTTDCKNSGLSDTAKSISKLNVSWGNWVVTGDTRVGVEAGQWADRGAAR